MGCEMISLAATVGVFTAPQMASVANLSRWAFLLTFAGVGLRTNISEMRKQGLRPLAVGAIGELGIAVLTLAMVLALEPMLGA